MGLSDSLSHQTKTPRTGRHPARVAFGRLPSPRGAFTLGLGIQFLVLMVLILPYSEGVLVLAGLLLLFSMLLRFRLPIAPRYMAVDCLLFCVASIPVPQLRLYLFVFVYYFAWHGKLAFALVPMAIGLVNSSIVDPDLVATQAGLFVLPLQALLSGCLLYMWKLESQKLLKEIDRSRQKIYRMEQTETTLLMDYQDAERLSQLVQRRKLAEKLHDNLGHELSAAHLSIKSMGVLLESGKLDKALAAQQKSEQRIHGALTQLKAAVAGIDPGEAATLHPLTELFERFVYFVELEQIGDFAGVQPYQRQLMYSVIKEALTNIAKHAVPTRVRAVIEYGERIIRISIRNNGVAGHSPDGRGAARHPSGNPARKAPNSNPPGNGLRYMRRRLEAIRGSLNTDLDGDAFSLIVTIPRQYPRQYPSQA